LATAISQRFEVAENALPFYDAMIEIDDASGKAIKIRHMSKL
jgi:calcineurin-like phosphoesterase